MKNESTWRNKLWEEYLPWAFALGVLLSLINYTFDAFYQVALLGVFFIASNLSENFKCLLDFIKKHLLFFLLSICSFIHFCLIGSGLSRSALMIVMIDAVVFAGYRLTQSGKSIVDINQKKYLIIVSALFAIGLIWYFQGTNETILYFPVAKTYYDIEPNRYAGFFMASIPCAVACCVYLLIVSAFVKNSKLKLPMLLFGMIVLFLTITRMTIIITLCALLFYVLFIRKLKLNDMKRIFNSNKIILLLLILLVIILVIFRKDKILQYVQKIIARFSIMSANKDWSVSYRVWVYQTFPSLIRKNNVMNFMFGSGMLKATETLRTLPGATKGFSCPVENTYLSLMYDFGFAGFALYFIATIRMLFYLFKDHDFYHRTVYLICLGIMAVSMTSDIEYWPNVSILLFCYIGIGLGFIDQRDSNGTNNLTVDADAEIKG